MKGELDSQLTWPFRGTVEVNQDNRGEYCARKARFDEIRISGVFFFDIGERVTSQRIIKGDGGREVKGRVRRFQFYYVCRSTSQVLDERLSQNANQEGGGEIKL